LRPVETERKRQQCESLLSRTRGGVQFVAHAEMPGAQNTKGRRPRRAHQRIDAAIAAGDTVEDEAGRQA